MADTETNDATIEETGSTGAAAEPTEETNDAPVDWEAKYKEVVAERDSWKAEARKHEKRTKASNKAAEKVGTEKDDAITRAEKAEAELAELKAEKARAELVAEIATDTSVNADILGKMIGATREEIAANAEILRATLAGMRSYPKVKDKPAGKNPPISKEEIRSIKNAAERRRAIAENLDLFSK